MEINCKTCGKVFSGHHLAKYCEECRPRKKKHQYKLNGKEKEQAILLLILLKDISIVYPSRNPDIQLLGLREAWSGYENIRVRVAGG